MTHNIKLQHKSETEILRNQMTELKTTTSKKKMFRSKEKTRKNMRINSDL